MWVGGRVGLCPPLHTQHTRTHLAPPPRRDPHGQRRVHRGQRRPPDRAPRHQQGPAGGWACVVRVWVCVWGWGGGGGGLCCALFSPSFLLRHKRTPTRVRARQAPPPPSPPSTTTHTRRHPPTHTPSSRRPPQVGIVSYGKRACGPPGSIGEYTSTQILRWAGGWMWVGGWVDVGGWVGGCGWVDVGGCGWVDVGGRGVRRVRLGGRRRVRGRRVRG